MLLRQMAEPGGAGRPPLFADWLLPELDEYRRFRHRTRHRYGHELKAERVLELARAAEPLLDEVREAVAAFNLWLEAQSVSPSAGDESFADTL